MTNHTVLRVELTVGLFERRQVRTGTLKCSAGRGHVAKNGIQRVKLRSIVVSAAAPLVVFFASILGCWAQTAYAEGPRHAAMIIDANTGKVLHDANADALRYPASLTKLMTLYLAFEALDQGRLTLDTQLTVSVAAASVAPSKLELAPGETIALADAIKALVTKSANDMAVAIAEKIAGDERTFAELMTKRARQIGMNSTTFRNASGLPDSGQQTTARDMLTLALRIYDDFPDKARVFSLREFTYQGKTYRTHNTLMKTFSGMDGMKTGYTSASGFNLVASVHRDGKHLVAAVFGGATASSRNAHMRLILNHALDDASTEKTRIAKPQLSASARPVTRHKDEPAGRRQADDARAVDVAQAQSSETLPWSPPDPAPMVKLATAPKPAARPTAQPVEAPKPVAVAKKKPAAVEAPAVAIAAAAPAAAEDPAPQQSISLVPPPTDAPGAPAELTQPVHAVSVAPPIIVASVRTIPITPDPIAAQAPASPPAAEAPATASASAVPKLDFAALRRAISGSASTAEPAPKPTHVSTPAPAATAPPRSDETIIAKADLRTSVPGRAPSTLEAQVAMLQPTSAPMPEAPAPMQQAARPPSTLGAQAAAVEAVAVSVSVSEPPMGLNGPAQGRTAAPASAIQIGAYSSAQEAERQLAAIQARASATLSGASPVARRIESGGRQLYAARFAGLDQAASTKACLALRQQSIDCFVVSSK